MFHVPAHKNVAVPAAQIVSSRESRSEYAANVALALVAPQPRAVRLSFVRITDCSYPRYNVYADRMYVGMVRKARSGWVAEGDSGTFAYDVTRRDAALTMAHREQGAA